MAGRKRLRKLIKVEQKKVSQPKFEDDDQEVTSHKNFNEIEEAISKLSEKGKSFLKEIMSLDSKQKEEVLQIFQEVTNKENQVSKIKENK